MLSQRMQHMIQKPNARIDGYRLALARLCCVPIICAICEAFVCICGEGPAVEVDGQLDFGFVGVAREGCGADSR